MEGREDRQVLGVEPPGSEYVRHTISWRVWSQSQGVRSGLSDLEMPFREVLQLASYTPPRGGIIGQAGSGPRYPRRC
jgi:hypothetical protein